ncbi:MAG: FHA domain-containing protein [Oscillospiraceae bacterium]
MFTSTVLTCSAQTELEANAQTAGESLVSFAVNFTDTNGKTTTIKYGTGFFISKGKLLTADKVAIATHDEATQLSSRIAGIADNYQDISKYSYTISITGRSYNGRLIYVRPAKGYAVIDVDVSTVSSIHTVGLGDSDTLQVTSANKSVTSIGFTDDETTYNPRNGIVTGIEKYGINGVDVNCFIHNAVCEADQLTQYIGGPLLDPNGYVVGLNYSMNVADNKAVAISINAIKEDLNNFTDIEYSNAGTTTPGGNTDSDTDSDASVDDSSNTTPAIVTDSNSAATTNKNKLETRDSSDDKDESFLEEHFQVIVIAAAGAAVLILIIVIVVVAGKGKNKNIPFSESIPRSQSGSFPPVVQPPYTSTSAQQPQFVTNGAGAAETSLLSADSNLTTVLSSSVAMASMVKTKTGETVSISRNPFVIGKDTTKATYCIKNNTSVSREHCRIMNTNGTFTIEDINSTNGTFVNGIRLTPRQPIQIHSGDKILIADEEYGFVAK